MMQVRVMEDGMQAQQTSATSRGRLLEPIDRISEVLFGLVMALTFTTTLDAATADQTEVRSLLVAALGCNIAWGLVDGLMYMTMGLVERSHGVRLFHRLRAADRATSHDILRDAVPPVIAATLDDDELDRMRAMLDEVDVPQSTRLRSTDWLGAVAVFALVFLSTFPVALPFALISDPVVALRTSNAVALVLLFVAGYLLGTYAGARPWRIGVMMAVLGSIVVVVTVALGG